MTWLDYLKIVTDVGAMSDSDFKRHINWWTARWIPVDESWKLQIRDSFFGASA